MKIHFRTASGSACGRGNHITEHVREVTCLNCQTKHEYIEAKANDALKRKEALDAQTPRQFREPWHSEPTLIVCRSCGHDLFRQGERTCYGHYDNYVCANCGDTASRLTETGMSF